MFDMHIQIDAPEVAEALNRLADALNAQTEVIRGGIPEIPATPKKKTAEAKAPEILAALSAIADGVTDPNDTAATKPAAPVAAAPAQPAIPTASAPAAPVAPAAPAAPAAQKTNITLNDIKRAGQLLMDAGKMNELLALLRTFGVEALPALKPEQYEAVAAGLRGLGAKI